MASFAFIYKMLSNQEELYNSLIFMLILIATLSWRSDLQNVKSIDENNFVEISKNGIETHFEVTDFLKYKCWAFKIENENIVGTWVGEFYSHGNKTTLDFTEDIVSKNFFFKPFIGFYIRKQQRRYFKDLKKELNCEEASFIQKL